MKIDGDWAFTPERAAVHMPTGTAVIADLHLGYDQVRRRGGDAIPDLGIDETIASLRALLVRDIVRRIVIAGDLCEDGRCPEHAIALIKWLEREGVELAGVVPGNHDRSLPDLGDSFPIFAEGLQLGKWHVMHGDGKLARGLIIQGHEHPCLRWARRLSAPCFLVGKRRIILPAFSADAAGVNVLRVARWRQCRCYVPVGEQVLDFGIVGGLAKKILSGHCDISGRGPWIDKGSEAPRREG